MSRVGKHVSGAGIALSLIMSAGHSLAKEPLLIIQLNQDVDVVEVISQDRSFKKEPLAMPVSVPDLRVVSAESLIFAKELGAGGEVAWCRACLPGWCPADEDLRYLIDDAGGVMGVQHREAGSWVELRDEDVVEEEMPAAAEIQSLKSHTIAVLEDKDGKRFGLVISGMVTPADTAENASYGPSMWLDPKVATK